MQVYKTGDELKKGLIDIDKVYEVVLQKEKEKDSEFVHEVRPISRQEKWKRVMAYMGKNPLLLMDALPNVPRTNNGAEKHSKKRVQSKVKPLNSLEKTEDPLHSSKLKSRLQRDIDLSKNLNQGKHTYGAPTKYGNFFD